MELYWHRWANARAGMKLSAVLPVLIPVKRVRIDVLIHEVTSYKLLNEHVLRAIDAGLKTTEDVSMFLGLSPELVSEGLAEEMSEGTILLERSGQFRLSDVGAAMLESLTRVEARRQRFSVGEDSLTSQIVSLAECVQGAAESENRDLECHQIPAPPRKGPINPKSIDLQELNSVLQLGDDKRVIRVDSARREPNKHTFRQAFALVFTDSNLSRKEVDIVIEDEISPRHSRALDPDEFLGSMDLKLAAALEPPTLSESLSEVRLIEPSAAAAVVQAIQSVEIIEGEADVAQSLQPSGYGMFKVQDRQPSRVTVYEHREILMNATQWATERLMIFSPWIRSGVVNRAFLNRLQKLLERGVHLTIVYGIGDASDNSEWSISQLCDLASRFTNFEFFRHQNTHAKAFIVDDCVVQTSFNWLSFAGDEKRTYRMEEGMRYVGAELASSFYAAYQRLLETEAHLACS